MNNLGYGCVLLAHAKSRVVVLSQASVRTTTTTASAKRTIVSGTKKDAEPKSKPKGDLKDKGDTKGLKKETSTVGAPHFNADGTRTSVWLMKSEPDTFSIDDLINSKDSTSHWEGVVSVTDLENNFLSHGFAPLLTTELCYHLSRETTKQKT